MCGHVPLYYGINLRICSVRLRHKRINMLLREKAAMDMFYYIAQKAYGHAALYYGINVWTCTLSQKRMGHVPLSKHKKVQKNAYWFWHGHTICKSSGKSPCPVTKRHLTDKRLKRWKMREKLVLFLVELLVVCSMVGRLLAWLIILSNYYI